MVDRKVLATRYNPQQPGPLTRYLQLDPSWQNFYHFLKQCRHLEDQEFNHKSVGEDVSHTNHNMEHL